MPGFSTGTACRSGPCRFSKQSNCSPSFSEARYLLMRIHAQQRDWTALGTAVEETLKLSPEIPTATAYREMVINSLIPAGAGNRH